MITSLRAKDTKVKFLRMLHIAVLLFVSVTVAAKPPEKYMALDKLTYDSQQLTLDKIALLRLQETDEVSLLWLTVLEAKALYHLNKFSESQSLLINVESAADDINDNHLKEMILRQMGQNFYRMGGFDQAMSYALNAQLIAEQNELLWEQAQIINLIAAIHLRAGELKLALEHFKQALAYFESIDAKTDVAKLKNNLGAVYIETNEFELATQYLADALSLAIEINRPTTIISALVNQIELNVKLNHFDKATQVYQTCLGHATSENLTSFEVWCHEAGALMYQQQGVYQQAIEVAKKAYQMANDQNLYQSQINLGKMLVELYSQTQQYELALTLSSLNLTQVEAIKDEVLKLKLDEVSALNDVEKTRSQLQFEREQNKLYLKNQRLTWAGIAILTPMLLIAVLLLRSKLRLVKALNAQQIETKNALAKMREAKEINEQLARTDALTGLFNRREISRVIESICTDEETENNACVLMLDVDYFKKINDQYGHAVGDKVLIELAHNLADLMPENAICARWGGEEFLVLLQSTELDVATVAAQNFVDNIGIKAMGDDLDIKITVSIGLSQKRIKQNMDDWILQADQALYLSKNNGRNQVTASH